MAPDAFKTAARTILLSQLYYFELIIPPKNKTLGYFT